VEKKTVPGKALLIGNSDGIGLAFTRELLKRGWTVVGVSKSESVIKESSYEHVVADVQDEEFVACLKSILKEEPIDQCMFCAGIGELLDISNMEPEVGIFNVNLMGMVKTASCVIPAMVKHGKGHFIGLSSVADEMLSPEAPSYHASKAGFTNYLEGLALALKGKGVSVSNVRFGFVDTKMAKGDVKPFMMGVDQAVRHLIVCMDKKPIRYTAPWIVVPLVKFRRGIMRLSTLFNRRLA
jgi:short-subunit dehydrogenase